MLKHILRCKRLENLTCERAYIFSGIRSQSKRILEALRPAKSLLANLMLGAIVNNDR